MTDNPLINIILFFGGVIIFCLTWKFLLLGGIAYFAYKHLVK